MEESSAVILNSVQVSRESGGLLEFSRSGNYPDYLSLKSSLLKKTWRQKVRSEKQNGTIKSNGRPLFYYQLTKKHFRMQYVYLDGSVTHWVNKDLILLLLD